MVSAVKMSRERMESNLQENLLEDLLDDTPADVVDFFWLGGWRRELPPSCV